MDYRRPGFPVHCHLSHLYMTTGKTIALNRQTFFGKAMSLLFDMQSRLVISFSSKEQASFKFMASVTICSDFRAQENKGSHCFHCFPIYLPWSDGTGWNDFVFWMLSFKPTFSLSSFTFKRLFCSCSLSAIYGQFPLHSYYSNYYVEFRNHLPMIGIVNISFIPLTLNK